MIPMVVVIIAGIMLYSSFPTEQDGGKYDSFAQCLTDKGITMYGAFWCPHCNEQKELFGKSMKYVDYVECSTPDRTDQTQVCKDANISGYPTWQLQNGTRIEGKIPLEVLSKESGCILK
jgi:hypothetical protein